MSTDNNAIQVLDRKLQVEIVVPILPEDLVDRVERALNNSNGRFVAKKTGIQTDGHHIVIKSKIRDQGSLQKAMEDLAHVLELSFRDSTNVS
jgi:hypothetical protein